MDRNNVNTTDTASRQSEPQGAGTLVSGLIEDLQSLVRSEVQLAKTELKEEATKIGTGAGMIAAGVFVALIGFIFLMLAATYLLNKAVQMWLAAGIVAVILLAVAAIVAMTGKKKIGAASLKPDQTIESVKETREWANRQIKSAQK